MSLTPRQIMLAARLGVAATVACAAGGLAGHGPIALGALSYGGTLAGLLAFPRIRRDDILIACVGGVTAAVALGGFSSGRFDLAGWAAAIAGIALTIVPLVVARVRRLAASNPHMPFSEWRTLERRGRRRGDQPTAETPIRVARRIAA